MVPLGRSLKAVMLLISLSTLLPKHNSQFSRHPSYIFHSCYNSSGNYTAGSPYNINLKSVLSDLSAHASVAQYYSSSAGTGTSTANGVYYCRQDLSLQLCSDCVNMAITNATVGSYCYPLMEGGVWYQECTLRYSNHSLMGYMEDWPRGWWYGNNVSDPDVHGQVLTTAMKRNIKTAASQGFAIGQDEVTPFETLYSLAQCRPDINGSVCQNCLLGLLAEIPKCCGENVEWLLIYNPSCQIRYGNTLFYENQTQTATNSTPPTTLPPPPLSGPSHAPVKDGVNYVTRIGIPVVAGLVLLLALVFGGWFCSVRKRRNVNSSHIQQQRSTTTDVGEVPDVCVIRNIECFDFKAIEEATMMFSEDNKLGQGGFGSVYKGILDGQLVAVKRLARSTGQHIKEFQTEVAVVARLQHRNLVRLVGFSIHQEERILVYEFLPNLSLDKFLFDATKSKYLDWRARYKIIEGVAWGLRYLHIDSLLTIIHRDLKSSNILLDKEMNPKIADFGLAKLVMVDQTTVNTSTVVGTHGYMAPEYVMNGRFSVKSDMYSFGVIILEIVTGKSISRFFDPVSSCGLLHCVWRQWSDGSIEGLVDPILRNNHSKIEVERCVQIGLLCVQDDMATRPAIRELLGMLENKSLELPYPSAPSSFYRNTYTGTSGNTTAPSAQTKSSGMEFNHHFNDIYPR